MLQQGEKLPAYMLQSRPRSHRYFAASSSLRSEFDKSLKRFHRDLSVCPTGGRGGLLRNAAEVEMGYTPLGGDGSSAQEVGAGGLVRILDSGSSSTNRGSEAQDAREKIPLREESAEEFLFRKTREVCSVFFHFFLSRLTCIPSCIAQVQIVLGFVDVQFNQTLEKNPKDVETWLEFSLFQEKFASLVGNGCCSSPNLCCLRFPQIDFLHSLFPSPSSAKFASPFGENVADSSRKMWLILLAI